MAKFCKRLHAIICVAALLAALFGQAGVAGAAPADPYEQMIERWSDYLTGGSQFDDNEPDIRAAIDKLTLNAQSLWSTMVKTAGRTTLWAGLEGTSNPAQISTTYGNLKAMTLAYKVKGSSLRGNEALKNDIISGLDWMYDNRYNPSIATYGNWWEWEIGTPLQLNDIVALLYHDLTPAQISNYVGMIEHLVPNLNFQNSTYTSTGANRVWLCKVVGISGVLAKKPDRVALASDGLSPVFEYVTSGDGFYEDGSFVQHTYYAYTGSYGVSLLQELTDVLYFLKGSSFENAAPSISNIFGWVYDAYEPLIYKGAMMEMVRGREIARSYNQDHLSGHNAISGIIKLSRMAEPTDAARLKAMVKAWIGADTVYSYYKDAGMSTLVAAKAIMNDPTVTPRSELLLSKVYAGMDRVVHLRPDFGFGVSMSSSRIANYESINKENLKGWFTGDGMTYLYNDDLSQYTDYWPTVNKNRLPGTTVDTAARADGSGAGYLSPNSWAGGTELMGQYSSAGMDLKAYGNTLAAKKSWFMFDDEVVALGSGINSTDGRTIETVIENRMLNKPTPIEGSDPASPPSVPLGSEPLRLKVYGVSDSGNDGNLPQNTIDNDLTTRWSSSGDGQWLQYDLGKIQPVGYAAINFFNQAVRYTTFDILVSTDNAEWTTVYSGSGVITPDASAMQVFDLTDSMARYVRLVGHGNSMNAWNSIAEVQLYAPSASGNVVIPPSTAPLAMSAITDSQGVSTQLASDGNIHTYWTADTDGKWLKLDLGAPASVGYAGLSFYRGNERQYSFEIQASADDNQWTAVYSGQSDGLTQEIQPYELTDTEARYWKIIVHGNSVDATSAISEIQLYAPNALGPVLEPLHNSLKYKGDEALVVNGSAKPAALGWNETMSPVSHIYLEGTGGYYFPQPATVKGLRETRTGSWSQVDGTEGSSTTAISKNYATLWVDHGANPVNAWYSYVLLPNKSAQQTAAYASNPDIQIIQNNSTVQAVKEIRSGITGANFWASGAVGIIKANQPSSLMMKEESGLLDVALSDPTQLQSKITYELGKKGISVVSKDPAVTVLQLSPTIKLEVNSAGSGGKSYHVQLQYDTSVPDVTMQGGLKQVTLTGAPIVEAGQTAALTLAGTTDDGSAANLADAAITYTSSKSTVASVTPGAAGSAAVTALVPGKTIITATVTLDGITKSATFPIEVPVGAVMTGNLTPVDDAYVRDGANADINFGTSEDLVVSNASPGYKRISLMKFDLNAIPGKVVSAALSVKARTADGSNPGASKEVKIFPAAVDTWSESTVTWNNMPAVGGTAITAQTIAYNTEANKAVWPVYDFDITPYIAQEKDGDRIASVAVAQEGSGIITILASKETAYKPNLRVVSYQPVQIANDVYPPTAPAASAGGQTSSSATLVWTASEDNLDDTVTYAVYRNGTFVANVSGLQFTDNGLAPSTAYMYTVKAKDAAGNLSASSNTVAIMTAEGSLVTRYEAEDAELTDVTVAAAKAGYSGTGYILDSSFVTNGDKVKFTVNRATAGAYSLKIRYSTTDNKPQYVAVNGGTPVSINFPNSGGNWATLDAGSVNLAAGSNTIEISKHWGWINLDYIEVGGAEGTVPPLTQAIATSLTGPASVMTGQDFTAVYGLTGVADSVYGAVYAQKVTLSFDPSLMEFVSAASVKTGVALLEVQTSIPGSVKLVMASQGPAHAITSDGAVLELHWKAKEVTANSAAAVTVAEAFLSDGLGRESAASGAAHSFSIEYVNKTALLALISQAQTVHDSAVEGTGIGQYPAGSKVGLLSAIQAAQTTAANGAATQSMTDAAAAALAAALQSFQASVITAIRGDMNQDGKISIGDLGFMAAHYGKTSGDSDWDSIKIADLDGDGRIGITDLAEVAHKVLD